MFITSFATLGALCALMSSSYSNLRINTYDDSNRLNVVSSYDIITGDIVGNAFSLTDLSIGSFMTSGNPSNIYGGQYNYYSAYVNGVGNLIGQFTFWFTSDTSLVPTFNCRFDFANQVNLRTQLYFGFHQGGTIIDNVNFDLNLASNDNDFTYTKLLASSLNITNSYFNMSVVLMPMSETEYNNTLFNVSYSDDELTTAYNNGYAAGYNEADNMDNTANSIFQGILNIGLIPVNFFLAILNFEVFGINIGAMVSALLTVCIAIIIFRIISNGGNKS